MKRLILYPTDLSPDAYRAFAHALKISLNDKSGIYIIHADNSKDKSIHWDNYPAVRDTLHKWGEIEANAEREVIHDKLGIDIKKVEAKAKNIIDAIIGFRKQHLHGIDLMVVGTQGRKGLPRWLMPSTSEHIALKANIPTLFVPNNTNKFVNPETGNASLKNVLIAVDHSPPAQISVTMAAEFLGHFRGQDPLVTILHIGSEKNQPDVDTDVFENIQCDYQVKPGDPVEEILITAKNTNADLIVMTSEGHNGFLDVLRGSVTERVLHESSCPLLMIPAS